MSWRTKANLKYIEELKAKEPVPGELITLPGGEVARVKWVARGEGAVYHEGERATLIEAFARRGAISRRSITRWDTGEVISEAEAERIIAAVSEALRRSGNENIRIL